MNFVCFRYLLLLWCILLAGCSPQPKDLPGFDEQAFADDDNGCAGERLSQQQQLFEVASQLKGLSEDEIVATLGRPDKQDLADRSQQFFIYYIDPAPACNQADAPHPPLTMLVRFSAMGLATEVNFQNYR